VAALSHSAAIMNKQAPRGSRCAHSTKAMRSPSFTISAGAEMYWIYDIPPLLAVGLFSGMFVGICWIGIILLSPRLVPWVHHQPGLNEILGDYLQYFGVIYGLLLGLLAVATYQNHSDVEKTVSNEASALAALYRDVSAYRCARS